MESLVESGLDNEMTDIRSACRRGDIGAMVEWLGTGKIRKCVLTDSIELPPSDQEEPEGYVRNYVELGFTAHNPARDSRGQGMWYSCEVVPCDEEHLARKRRWHGRGKTLLEAVRICLWRYGRDEQGDCPAYDLYGADTYTAGYTELLGDSLKAEFQDICNDISDDNGMLPLLVSGANQSRLPNAQGDSLPPGKENHGH